MEAIDLSVAQVQVAETTKRVGLEISQATAYRLRQRIRQGGEQARQEGRRRYPVTMRGSPVVGTDLSADSFSPEPRDPNTTG